LPSATDTVSSSWRLRDRSNGERDVKAFDASLTVHLVRKAPDDDTVSVALGNIGGGSDQMRFADAR